MDELPELQQLTSGRGLVRIPVEQDVPFSPRVRAIVDTPQFQRLRRISQLGLASLVYPGATHTRFEHALGVFHNALKYLWQLGRDARFAEVMDRQTMDVLLCAALLHDLGHWPFCHAIEDIALPEVPQHESFARVFLAEGSELADVLRGEWNVEPQQVLDVLEGHTPTPAGRLAHSILSGPIDIDKMDYLDRDSLHCGVPYGRNFDRQRLIQSLMLNADGDGLALRDKGRTAAELMVFARYVMFSEVYWHHAVRSATAMFARAFFELHQQLNLEHFFLLGEHEAVLQLQQLAVGSDAEILLDGLFGRRRQLYKRVAEFGPHDEGETFSQLAGRPYGDVQAVSDQFARNLSQQWQCDVCRTEVLIDAPPPHREVQFRVPIFNAKTGEYRLLAEVSPVVSSLARDQFDETVKRVRVFMSARLRSRAEADPRLRETLQSAVQSFLRNS